MQLLDLTPHVCPLPLIKVKLWLKNAELGSALVVLLKDPGSRQDIPAYLTALGNMVRVIEDDALLRIEVQKCTQHLSLQ